MRINRQDKIKTEFGNARIHDGYYYINNVALHRIIFEDYYSKLYGCGYKIPKGFVIHHIDGNKLNNSIMNLELLSDFEHKSLHNKGNIIPKEVRDKISKTLTGKTQSEETKLKKSKALTGKPKSKEHCKNISKGQINKLPIIRKRTKKNKWVCQPRYKDGDKNKTTCIERSSLTDCIIKVDEFLNSERNNLGLVEKIIEIDINEDI